jgi:methylphosphotriester-DNA--protein-cysteine methyltransferase
MQMLRKQALMPSTGNSDAATGESDDKQEQKMSLEEMAFKVNLSESRMRALFKSKVGLPPTQYIIKMQDEGSREKAQEFIQARGQDRDGPGLRKQQLFRARLQEGLRHDAHSIPKAPPTVIRRERRERRAVGPVVILCDE